MKAQLVNLQPSAYQSSAKTPIIDCNVIPTDLNRRQSAEFMPSPHKHSIGVIIEKIAKFLLKKGADKSLLTPCACDRWVLNIVDMKKTKGIPYFPLFAMGLDMAYIVDAQPLFGFWSKVLRLLAKLPDKELLYYVRPSSEEQSHEYLPIYGLTIRLFSSSLRATAICLNRIHRGQFTFSWNKGGNEEYHSYHYVLRSSIKNPVLFYQKLIRDPQCAEAAEQEIHDAIRQIVEEKYKDNIFDPAFSAIGYLKSAFLENIGYGSIAYELYYVTN